MTQSGDAHHTQECLSSRKRTALLALTHADP